MLHCRAADSTGIKVEGEGKWHARKHGGPKRRVWRKIHLGIDEETQEVRAVEITGSHIGDAPVLPDLLSQIPMNEEIGMDVSRFDAAPLIAFIAAKETNYGTETDRRIPGRCGADCADERAEQEASGL